MLNVIGWILFGLVALNSAMWLLTALMPGDAGGRWLYRVQCLIWVTGLAATATLGTSKFHLIWIYLVGAMAPYAIMYFRSMGNAPQHYVEAARRFLKAAEQGNATSQHNLGVCYRDGTGVHQDYVEAAKWFRKAADQGFAAAQYNLGVCYRDGTGVPQNYLEAVKWFRKAADQGFALAPFNLAVCYTNGQGVAQNYMDAYAWHTLGSKMDKEAADARDALEKIMTPQQVADAQKRTRELRAEIEAKLKGGN